MLINPIVLFFSLLTVFLSFIVSIAKKPRFPILTVTGICISTMYLFFAYLINGAMYRVTEFSVPESVLRFLLGVLISKPDISTILLENAFTQYAIAETGFIVITVAAIVYDVKRIFFGKMYI